MKIIALQAENIKRLVAVEIRPDGNLVQITGKNGQGKTSVLDCLWWALGGMANVQGQPIRTGQKTARIRLDLGELIVTRTFLKADAGAEAVTSSITVTSATGARFNSPQTMLDQLLGELTFDPLAFARSTPREQYEALRRFVPGVDFDAIEEANERDFEERTVVNRKAKEARIYADKIAAPLNAPTVRVEEQPLIKELGEASAFNSDIATRAERRTNMAAARQQHFATAEDYEAQAAELKRKAAVARQAGETINIQLSSAPTLLPPKDVTSIQARIDETREANAKYDLVEKKRSLLAEAYGHDQVSDAFTSAIAQRERVKQAAIAKAKMPVEGLGFGKGIILFNALPFEQASDAEQLRVSMAIAMALSPKLRVLRVRDGSLLDADSMKLLATMADTNDFQVWVERVEDSGKVGFVLEDGRIKQTEDVHA